MGIWLVVQRLGGVAAQNIEGLSACHADSRGATKPVETAPDAVVLGLDGRNLGMRARRHRRSHTTSDEPDNQCS